MKRVPLRFFTSLKKIRVYLTHVKGLAQPLMCNRFKKMVDAHSRNIWKRNKLDMPSFRSTAGQRPLGVHLWNEFAESSGNIENLEQLKAEVKKRHFLIYSIFFPINFTYCKVDNYTFNCQTSILNLAERPFYEVG